MSDEQRKEEESEVEAHRASANRPGNYANDEPGDEAEADNEVEAHRASANRASANRPDNY